MLSSEFSQEVGGLVRSLEQRIRVSPNLQHEDLREVSVKLDELIVVLCALRIQLGRE